MMQSYYSSTGGAWNDGTEDLVDDEQPCKRCHGLGEDRDGADCVFCDGFGSILR